MKIRQYLFARFAENEEIPKTKTRNTTKTPQALESQRNLNSYYTDQSLQHLLHLLSISLHQYMLYALQFYNGIRQKIQLGNIHLPPPAQ